MPITPIASNENLTLAAEEPGRRPGIDGELRDTPPDGKPGAGPADGETAEPLPVVGDEPDVGLAQKGTGEDAIVRRETEI